MRLRWHAGNKRCPFCFFSGDNGREALLMINGKQHMGNLSSVAGRPATVHRGCTSQSPTVSANRGEYAAIGMRIGPLLLAILMEH